MTDSDSLYRLGYRIHTLAVEMEEKPEIDYWEIQMSMNDVECLLKRSIQKLTDIVAKATDDENGITDDLLYKVSTANDEVEEFARSYSTLLSLFDGFMASKSDAMDSRSHDPEFSQADIDKVTEDRVD
jgi:hypothetical protein